MLVHDQDFSSVIAYSLASFDYKRKLDSLSYCDNNHRKSYDAAATDTEESTTPASATKENEKEKKTKPTQAHVDMTFQDSTTATQFTCRVYFARDFDLMRTKMLSVTGAFDENDKTSFYRNHTNSDSESKLSKDFDRKSSNISLNTSCEQSKCDEKTDEKSDDFQKKDLDKVRAAFIRSLSKSVRWEARGGKSGSKFCKTMGKTIQITQTVFSSFINNFRHLIFFR